jgi:hypothetical protein
MLKKHPFFMLVYLLLSLCLLFQSACTPRVQAAQSMPLPDELGPTAIPIAFSMPGEVGADSAIATPTENAQHSDTPVPTATPQVFISAQGGDLYAGPSALFPSLGILPPQDTKVTVLVKARGDDWLFIDDGQRKGWVYREDTNLGLPDNSIDLSSLPILDTGKAMVIQGRVVESNGTPLAGVEVIANPANAGPLSYGARANSLVDGYFYLYLPEDASGTWEVGLGGIDCRSPITDANCHTTLFMPEGHQFVTLPDNRLVEFYFTR